MTETERRMAWHEACAAIILPRDQENWPDRLKLSVIARLHDPNNFKGLLSFLEAEADAGRPATESHERQHIVQGRRCVTSAYLTRRPSEVVQLTPDRTQTIVWRSARADHVAAVISRKVIEQSPFLFAWLEPFLQAEAQKGQAATYTTPTARPPSASAHTRDDDMTIELNQLIKGIEGRGEKATPAKVMAQLKERAGEKGSCISGCAADGVLWTRSTTGANEKLTMGALTKRLRRRANATQEGC